MLCDMATRLRYLKSTFTLRNEAGGSVEWKLEGWAEVGWSW